MGFSLKRAIRKIGRGITGVASIISPIAGLVSMFAGGKTKDTAQKIAAGAGAIGAAGQALTGSGPLSYEMTPEQREYQRLANEQLSLSNAINRQYYSDVLSPNMGLQSRALSGLQMPLQYMANWIGAYGPERWGFGKLMTPPDVAREGVDWASKPTIDVPQHTASLPQNVTTHSILPTTGILGGLRRFSGLEGRYTRQLPTVPDWQAAGKQYADTMSAASLMGLDRQANQLSGQAAAMLAERGLGGQEQGASKGIGLWARRTGAEMAAQNLQNRLAIEQGLRNEQAQRAQTAYEMAFRSRAAENEMLLARQRAEQLAIEAENARLAGDFERARQISQMANEENYKANVLRLTAQTTRADDWFREQMLRQQLSDKRVADEWAKYEAMRGERDNAKQDYMTMLGVISQIASGNPAGMSAILGSLANSAGISASAYNQAMANALAAQKYNTEYNQAALSNLMLNLPTLLDLFKKKEDKK